ncbi:MAG: hypothetical protein F6J93_08865 [Oscillatoria sp. SIO1A7]|nr:hypothetical protein [Oscillatoria sp. SIO1A7]
MTKVALSIAVSRYDFESTLRPLPTAERDVLALASGLQDPEKGGFTEVEQLINPDVQTMRSSLEQLFRGRAEEDLLLLYFSGHAIADEAGKLYLAATNTEKRSLESTAISTEFLRELMDDSGTKQQVAILDCCSSQQLQPGASEIPFKPKGVIQIHLTSVAQKLNAFREAAENGGDKDADNSSANSSENNSANSSTTELSSYTYYLLEGLLTGAADRDKDGAISVWEWHDYAKSKVLIAAPAREPAIYKTRKAGQMAIANSANTPQLQYRRAVENFVCRNNGEISALSARILEIRQERLGLSLEETAAIQESVLKPYRDREDKLQKYEEVLVEAIQLEGLPLSQDSLEDLRYFQETMLALTDKDVVAIHDRRLDFKRDRAYPVVMVGGLAIAIALAFGINYLIEYISAPTPPEMNWGLIEKILSFPSSEEEATDSETPAPEPTPSVPTSVKSIPQTTQNLAENLVTAFRVPTEKPITLKGHAAPVQAATISADGKILVSGSWDNTIKIWDLATNAIANTLNGHSLPIRQVAISPDGQTLASASDDKTVMLWDLATGSLKATLGGHGGRVYAVAISADGKIAVSGSEDKTIKVWDLATGEVLATLRGHKGQVRAIAISPDNQTLVSGGSDRSIAIWNLQTGSKVGSLEGHTDLVRALAISPDGKTVVSGSWDKTLKVWSLESGELLRTIAGHSDKVTSVTFSPGGRTIVSGSDDNSIKIWSLDESQTEEEAIAKGTLTDHSSDVFSVAISPDGKTLVSASWDKTIKIWR